MSVRLMTGAHESYTTPRGGTHRRGSYGEGHSVSGGAGVDHRGRAAWDEEGGGAVERCISVEAVSSKHGTTGTARGQGLSCYNDDDADAPGRAEHSTAGAASVSTAAALSMPPGGRAYQQPTGPSASPAPCAADAASMPTTSRARSLMAVGSCVGSLCRGALL